MAASSPSPSGTRLLVIPPPETVDSTSRLPATSASNSAGPNINPTEASAREKKLTTTAVRMPATNEPIVVMPRTGPARPCWESR